MKKESKPRFVACINNAGYEDDLKLRLIYRVLPDESAARSNYIRIIDETGEDYLFPGNYFVELEMPPEAENALLHTVTH